MDKNYIVIMRTGQRLWVDGPTFVEIMELMKNWAELKDSDDCDSAYTNEFCSIRTKDIAAIVPPEMLERPGLSKELEMKPPLKKFPNTIPCGRRDI